MGRVESIGGNIGTVVNGRRDSLHGRADDVIANYFEHGTITGVDKLGRKQKQKLSRFMLTVAPQQTGSVEAEVTGHIATNGHSTDHLNGISVNGLENLDVPEVDEAISPPETETEIKQVSDTKFKPLGIRSSYHDVRNQGKLETSDVAGRFFHRRATQILAAIADPERMEARIAAKRARVLGADPSPEAVKVFDQKERSRLSQTRARATRTVNMLYYNEVGRTFGLPLIDESATPEDQQKAREAIESFIEHHRKIARDTWNYLTEKLYPHTGRLDLRNEVSFSAERPAQWVEEYAAPSTDPIAKAQMVNIELFAANSAEKSLLDKETRPSVYVSRIQRLLVIALNRSGIGDATEMKIDGWYDNETNEVKYVDGINGVKVEGKAPVGMRKITREVAARYVPDLEMTILTDPREKTDESFLTKAARYGEIEGEKTEDDTIDVSKVQDTHGMKFGAYGGLDERELLMLTINDILKNPKSQLVLCDKDLDGRPLDVDGNPVDIDVKYILENFHNPEVTVDPEIVDRLKGRWISSIEDHVTSNGDSSSDVDFLRLQIMFEGTNRPIELIFQDIFSYLNDIYHTGTFDPEKKRYSGAHHAGLKNAQARRVGKRIFSRDLYGLDIVGQSVRVAHNIHKKISALGVGRRNK